jgi:hypothetical protein
MTGKDILSLTFLAYTDLSTKQYKFMAVPSSTGTVNTAGSAVATIGILQDKPSAANRPACVRVAGVSKLVLGGTVTAGARLTPDTNGDGVATVANLAEYGAIALEPGDDNDVIEVLLERGTVSSNT